MNDSSIVIKGYKIFKATVKLDKPIADATHTLQEISFIVLRIQVENGISGESYLLSFQYSPNALRGALKDLLPLIVSYKINDMGKVADLLNNVSEYFGQTGINRWIYSLVNIAMWDAWGKTLGQPVHKLDEVTKDRVPVYGSGGWLSYSLKELIAEVSKYIERGFKTIKIKVGLPDWKSDLDRIKKVREVAGDEINIIIDANQGMDVSSACQLALAAREYNISWFEEPVDHYNYDGYQTIKDSTGISLCMGEREYDTVALTNLIQRKSIDIWQPDILRIGGVEAWKNSADIAEINHVDVLPHYYKEYDVPLLCTLTNGLGAESFDWTDSLVDNPIVIKDGYAYPHEAPGWGFNFQNKYLQEIRL